MLPNAFLSFDLFGKTFSFHMYGLMIGIGVLLCFVVLFTYAKKLGYDPAFIDFVFYNGIASIIGGFASAALFQAFYNYLAHPELGFHIGQGLTFIGGALGGAVIFLVVYFIFRKKYKKTRLADVISLIPCCIFIAHGFGRVGCFFAGCCYGKVTHSFLGVKFPYLSEPVYPTQLYEAAFLFIMFGVCSYLLLKKNFRHNLSLWLISYGIFRFFIEFLRGDARGSFIPGLSPSQFWSIIMVVLGVGCYFLLREIYRRQDAQKTNENP